MEDIFKDYQRRLLRIEKIIREQKNSYEDLVNAAKEVDDLVKDLKNSYGVSEKEFLKVMTSVDKDLGIQEEKLANIFYQLEQLEKRITALESSTAVGSTKDKEALSKVLLLAIGALATQIVSALQK